MAYQIPTTVIAALKASLEKVTVEGFARVDGKYTEVDVHPTLFERDGTLILSAEDGNYFADYYGEFRGGFPWIHPTVEALAKANGGYWEWENPGCIAFTQ